MEVNSMYKEMVTISQRDSHPMNGGDTPYNYALNSNYQRGVIEAANAKITEAIAQNLDIFSNLKVISIADLGCSIGPNTFIAMENAIEAINLKNPESQTLEFQVMFNDHVNNDFNTLFTSLPPCRHYYAAGVPGSFYGRLFPAKTLNFALSSYALHWLSKVPDGIGSSNKGKTYCSKTLTSVTKAYFDQFKKDMDDFLNARVEEVVEGGMVVITIASVPNDAIPSQTGAAMLQEVLGSCLIHMVKMGLVSEEKVDSFNVPLYFPTPDEMKSLIDMNSHFSILKMETLTQPINTAFHPQNLTLQFRAVMEGVIVRHFGVEIIEKLFQIYMDKLEENRNVFENELRSDVDLFIILKRKANHV